MYDTIACHEVRALFDGTTESCPDIRVGNYQNQSDKAHDMSEEEKLIVQDVKRGGNMYASKRT